MAAMRVVKTAVNQIIDMVAMRNSFVAAARAMSVGVLMNLLRAAHRVLGAHLDHVLFGMAAAGMHEASVLQIVHVIPVADSQMPAARAVLMVVWVLHYQAPTGLDDCVLPWIRRAIHYPPMALFNPLVGKPGVFCIVRFE
jgi:hypothetical protein